MHNKLGQLGLGIGNRKERKGASELSVPEVQKRRKVQKGLKMKPIQYGMEGIE